MGFVIVIALVVSHVAIVNGCPLGCKCVKENNSAICTSAEFDTPPKGFPLYIKEISLADNKIQMLGPKAFQRQLSLIRLNISQNEIFDISADAFVASSEKYENKGEMADSLLFLSLQCNKLTFVPSDALKHLQELTELALAENKISMLKSGSFVRLSKLETLDLSKNLIEMTAVDAFQDLQGLEILNLSGNSLSLLSPSTLGHLTSLKQLHMERNSIRKIHPLAFSHFTMLQELYLSTNRIKDIPDKLFASTAESLLSIDLSRNEIKELHSHTFKGLRRLQSLKLSHNQLACLHDTHTMSAIFTSLTFLKLLKLDSNRIDTLHSSSWEGLDHLQELTLTGNLIKNLPGANLPGLEILDMSANLLSTLNKSSFHGFPFLQRLDLSDNVITDVTHDAFSGCHHLRNLHLERNRLTTPFTEWMTLTRYGPKRTHINDCVGHLADNPWRCDCRTWAFARSVAKSRAAKSENEKIYVNSDVMKCDDPEPFRGQTLTEFAENTNLRCDVTMPLTIQQLRWVLLGSTGFCVVFVLVKGYFALLKHRRGKQSLFKPDSKHL